MVSGSRVFRPKPAELAVFLGCIAGMVVHQAFRWSWYIEDSAICFAYARNLVEGHGLVPSPGGERVEAYSDPLWVAILAVFQAVGLDGFTVSKPLAMLFGVGTLFSTWRLAARALPEHLGPGALLAPVALALNAQFAIWSASGLENALFCLLLSAGLLRTLIEIEDGGLPWSAVLYLLLALTRPEGLGYAALAGFAYLVGTRGRGWRPAAIWAGVVLGPYLALELVRIWYFAWPLPNTFYAKITGRANAPLNWSGRGWNQMREWADRLWQGWLAPVYAVGLTGLGRRSTRIALGVVGLLAVLLLWPGPEDLQRLPFWPDLPRPPQVYLVGRLLLLFAAGLALPGLALGGPGGPTRALCGWTAIFGLGFAIYADGDWMGGFRFMSLVTPPLATLLAVGLVELADAIEQATTGQRAWLHAGWLAAAGGVGLVVPPNLWATRDHVGFNQDVTVDAIQKRVDYLRSVARRTFYDGPISNLDIDQGAFLWHAPDFRELDMGLLVEVPMARHWFQQRPFVREYLFDEVRPTFANVGGWWTDYTGFRKYREWSQQYFETPGYKTIWGWPFVGVFARRDLVLADRWDGTAGRKVGFDWDIALEGWEQPAPWVAGEPGYLEAPFSVATPRKEGQEVAVVGFVAKDGAVLASFSLPMGYGLLPMKSWRAGEVFRGRHAIPVPPGLPPGRYDLGFVLTGPRGRIIPAEQLPDGALADPPALARGEVRFPGAIEVVAAAELDRRIDAVRAELADQASHGECEAAESTWVRLKRHRPEDWAWQDEQQVGVAPELAECWAARAEHDSRRPVDALAWAHRWDPDSPTLERVGGPIADRLYDEGLRARAVQDWETAYDRFADLLRFEPWRAWARRYAEEARDHRLGLTGDVRNGIGGYDDYRGPDQGKAP
jgi:hypothetical protein